MVFLAGKSPNIRSYVICSVKIRFWPALGMLLKACVWYGQEIKRVGSKIAMECMAKDGAWVVSSLLIYINLTCKMTGFEKQESTRF